MGAPGQDQRVPGERIYRLLLRAFPSEFRETYGDAMVEFYRDRWQGGAAALRGAARLRFWLRIAADVFAAAAAEWITVLRARWSENSSQTSTRSGGVSMGSRIWQDLHFARRTLFQRPAFAVTVLLTLALGIGANVAIFAVVNGVLLRALPFHDADRIIQLSNGDFPSTVSEPEFVDLVDAARSFTDLGAYSYTDGNITGDQEAERVRLARVTAGFFGVLAPTPYLGRGFIADEDVPGAPDVVVLSYGLWQRRFGFDSTAIGKTIVINDAPRTIVGVMPPNFDFPTSAVSVWTPLRLNRDSLWARANHYLRVIGRLAPDATVASAHAEVAALNARWIRDYPDTYNADNPLVIDVALLRERVLGPTRPYLFALLGAVGLVLLIACVNVANLLLARGEGRRRELAIRSALGASRGRIALQLSTESALLTLLGGLLGVALAYPLTRLLVASAPGQVPRLAEIRIDLPVLTFAVGVGILTGLLFGLVPVLRTMRVSALAMLGSGARSAAAVEGSGSRRTRAVLVISEIALAVIMLCGAGLFARSLVNLQRTELGFATHNVLTARLSLPRSAYESQKAVALIDALVARAGALPGVQRAAAMAWTPIVDGGGNWSIVSDAMAPATIAEAPTASPQQVTPGFFQTVSIPFVRGRDFTSADHATAPLVAIVNETMARKLWGNADPIGRRFGMFNTRSEKATVVGVVRDTRVDGVTEPVPPVMYFPHAQAQRSAYFTALNMTLLIQSTASVAALLPGVKQVVRELDPNVPLSDVRTLEEIVGSSIARHRFTTMLLSGFALLALLLASVGIYGVIAYGVSQRRYEFGVRMALGAARGRVLGLVLREGLLLVICGLALGLAGAVVCGRLLRSMLVGVTALDAPTLLAVSMCLLAAALVALLIPARTALAVDPREALG
jgi:putative ABC transport system permease protein